MPLDQNSVFFLILVFVGAVVQSLTGFAMALIILGGVAALGLAGISETAAVVSILSLFNAGLALRYNYRLIDYTLMKTMSIGMVPAVLPVSSSLNTCPRLLATCSEYRLE